MSAFTPSAVGFMAFDPGQQRLRRAANLRRDGFDCHPQRRILGAVLLHQPHGTLATSGETCPRCSCSSLHSLTARRIRTTQGAFQRFRNSGSQLCHRVDGCFQSFCDRDESRKCVHGDFGRLKWTSRATAAASATRSRPHPLPTESNWQFPGARVRWRRPRPGPDRSLHLWLFRRGRASAGMQ